MIDLDRGATAALRLLLRGMDVTEDETEPREHIEGILAAIKEGGIGLAIRREIDYERALNMPGEFSATDTYGRFPTALRNLASPVLAALSAEGGPREEDRVVGTAWDESNPERRGLHFLHADEDSAALRAALHDLTLIDPRVSEINIDEVLYSLAGKGIGLARLVTRQERSPETDEPVGPRYYGYRLEPWNDPAVRAWAWLLRLTNHSGAPAEVRDAALVLHDWIKP